MVEHRQTTRRTALKKGAAAASLLAGGVVAGSGSATASSFGVIRLRTEEYPGDFLVHYVGTEPDTLGDPLEFTATEISTNEWVCTGTVQGGPNRPNPNHYVDINVDEFEGIESSDNDSNVDMSVTVID